jgi:hypothetical protein
VTDDLERRLRDSLRAYAETVDEAEDDDSLPTRPAAQRSGVRRWRGAVLAAAAAAAVVTGSLVVVNARDTGSDTAAGPAAGSSVSGQEATHAEAPASTTPSGQALAADAAAPVGGALPASPEAGVAYSVDLSTHCGVRGLEIGGVWFAADPPLVEEGGHPPAGWGNPLQPGTVTLLSATEAVFTDDLGHEVRLRADESARPPLCE